MATMKIKFRASSSEKKEGTLFYQVIHNRVARQVRSGYKLYPHEWDSVGMAINIPPCVGKKRRIYLSSLKEALVEDAVRMRCIISRLERNGNPYTADRVVEDFLSPTADVCFISFARNLIMQVERIGNKPVMEKYATAINSFERFRKGKDVLLDEMDSDLMTAYEAGLVSAGVCHNTVSFYMRNLRAIYNRAVDKELTLQRYPFKHVYTGIDKTVKRAVPLNIIRRIRDLDLASHPSMDYARDIFMFSFYTRGMSFVDIAFLKKRDLQGGVLSYRRHKTSQQMFIKWEKPMQEIVDKYETLCTQYLLPVIINSEEDERRQYLRAVHRINQNLKKIGVCLGLSIPLTTYVARHAWASIAKSKNVSISTISEAMGHDSENTTRIYLASLDTSAVDKANSIILESL